MNNKSIYNDTEEYNHIVREDFSFNMNALHNIVKKILNIVESTINITVSSRFKETATFDRQSSAKDK